MILFYWCFNWYINSRITVTTALKKHYNEKGKKKRNKMHIISVSSEKQKKLVGTSSFNNSLWVCSYRPLWHLLIAFPYDTWCERKHTFFFFSTPMMLSSDGSKSLHLLTVLCISYKKDEVEPRELWWSCINLLHCVLSKPRLGPWIY